MTSAQEHASTDGQRIERATAQLRSLVRLMLGARLDAWVELDLTVPQIKLLLLLNQAGSQTVGQIAERLRVGQSAASHVVERLVQAGLGERSEDPADRRRAIVRLSPGGRALAANLLDGTEFLRDWLAALTPDQLAALSESIGALVAVAQRGEVEGSDLIRPSATFSYQEKV